MDEAPKKDVAKNLKEKAKLFLKDNYNLVFLGIILWAFAIRLYYFSLTKNQPLWWDEAEYMIAAKSFFFKIPTTGLSQIREMVVPLFWGILYLFSKNEYLIRFFQVVVSTLTVGFTFSIGKRLFDKKVGLIASFLMSVFCIQLFFTARILTYLWAPLIYFLAIFFFLKRDENKKYYYLSAGIIALGIVAYFSTSFLLITLLLFLLIDEKLSFFKKKSNYLALLSFLCILVPFVIYYMATKGAPLPRFFQIKDVLNTSSHATILPFYQWFGYFQMFPRLLLFPLLIVFIIGIFYLLELILGFDLILKNKSEDLKNKLLVILWILIPIILYQVIEIMQGVIVLYDAFILPVLPAVFIICALVLMMIYNQIKKYSKVVGLVVVIALLIWSAYAQVTYADAIIKGKISSYDSVKEAGVYLKTNSNPGDVIRSQAVPALTYYSERVVYGFDVNQSDFEKNISIEKPRFLVLTIYEPSPEWTYNWPANNTYRLKAEKVFTTMDNNPSTIIYKFTY